MSWLARASDWFVDSLYPGRAAKRRFLRALATDPDVRELARTMLRLNLDLRGYRAAGAGTNSGPWSGGTQTADQEVSCDLPTLRARSRELNRDDSLASGLTRRFVSEVVGTGIRPRAKAAKEKKALADACDLVWKARSPGLYLAERAGFAAGTRVLFHKILEDGDVFIKAAKRSPEDPVWFELIEADRCVDPNVKRVPAGHSVQDGVERDESDCVVAYWFKASPRKLTDLAKAVEPMRVEAPLVCHMKLADRPGQTRGVPLFHAISQDLRDLDLLILASLKRTQVAACLAAFITSDANSEDMFDLDSVTENGASTGTTTTYKLQTHLEPGLITKLLPGEKMETLIPNFPVPEMVPFVFLLCRRIGTALGISWQEVLRDFSGASYSSARTDKLDNWATYDLYQSWLIDECLAWQWRTGLVDSRALGALKAPEIPEAVWIPDGRQWVDPRAEAEAIKLKLALGLTTWQAEAAAIGSDWEELADQIEIENVRREEIGLPPLAVTNQPQGGFTTKTSNTEPAPTAPARAFMTIGRGD